MGADLRRTAAAVLCAAAIATPMSVCAEDATNLTPPVVDKEEWRIGVAVLDAQEESASMLSAASLLPRLIRDELDGVDRHLLTREERFSSAEEILQNAILTSFRRLSNLHASRDDWIFSPNADPQNLRNSRLAIDEENAVLDYLKSLSPGDLEVPESLPVSIPAADGGGGIWNPGDIGFDSLRERSGLDILIGGSLVKVGDYYGIRIISYGVSGETVLWEGAAGEAQLEEAATEAGAAARRLILGRPWTSLSVVVEPSDAIISVDGSAVGVGSWSDSTLMPGDIILEITSTGYEPLVSRETLQPGERRVLNLALEPSDRPSSLIRSVPTGADVRLGVLWLGRTPLSVELPDRVMPLTLEKEGFRTRTVPLSTDTEGLTVPLEARLVDPALHLAGTKKKLHNSIAWFSFSLAPTIALLGVSQNYAGKFFASTTYDDQYDAYNAYYLTRGFMWAGVAVNTAFLTVIFIRLSRYLKAAEELSD
ncbi:MAG: PEGA domain-containing protein [Spirochaetaceae bacterium]|nr:PEGA domain-containing protein [Spirochaetaceae bacterium]